MKEGAGTWSFHLQKRPTNFCGKKNPQRVDSHCSVRRCWWGAGFFLGRTLQFLEKDEGKPPRKQQGMGVSDYQQGLEIRLYIYNIPPPRNDLKLQGSFFPPNKLGSWRSLEKPELPQGTTWVLSIHLQLRGPVTQKILGELSNWALKSIKKNVMNSKFTQVFWWHDYFSSKVTSIFCSIKRSVLSYLLLKLYHTNHYVAFL